MGRKMMARNAVKPAMVNGAKRISPGISNPGIAKTMMITAKTFAHLMTLTRFVVTSFVACGSDVGFDSLGTVKVWMTRMRANVSITMTAPVAEKTTASDLPAVRLTAATIRPIAPAIASRSTAIVRRVERREYAGLCRHAPQALYRKSTAKMSWNIGDLGWISPSKTRLNGGVPLDHMRWGSRQRCEFDRRFAARHHLSSHAPGYLAC